MSDILGWTTVGIVLGMVPVLLFTGLRHVFSRKGIEEKYEGMPGGGLIGGFDAVWTPSAHEAGIERDRQAKRTAPAPSPGDPPWTLGEGRITLDV